MSIALTGSGGLFTRLGHLGGILNYLNAVRGGSTTSEVSNQLTAKVLTVQSDYENGTARPDLISGTYSISNWLSTVQNGITLSMLQQIAQQTLIQMANDDTKLSSLTVSAAMSLLIQQMTGNYHVSASTVAAGSQTSVGSPTGNPIVVMSVLDGRGLGLDYALPDTMTFACSADAQTGNATQNQEAIRVTSIASQGDTLNWLWGSSSYGAGVNSSITLVDASVNDQAGTLLQNGDFEIWTNSNVPDNWTIATGTAGTTVLKGSGGYTGSYSLEFASDGTTLIGVTQSFDTTPATGIGAGGTSETLSPWTPYAVNGWVKMSATPAAGVLEIALITGVGGVIQDDQGNDNLISVNLTGVSTSWVNFNGVFRLPRVLPSSTPYKLWIRLSTAVDSGKNVFIDRVAMAAMNQITPSPSGSGLAGGGPYYTMFSGATPVIVGDSWTIAITNTWGGFQQLFERFFGMKSLGMRLPTSGGTAISDSLIA